MIITLIVWHVAHTGNWPVVASEALRAVAWGDVENESWGHWSVTADSREAMRGQAACRPNDTPCIHPTHTNLPTADVGHRLEHIYSLWARLFDGHTRRVCQLVCVYKSDCVWEFCTETRCVWLSVVCIWTWCVWPCVLNAGVWEKNCVHVHLICITMCVCETWYSTGR